MRYRQSQQDFAACCAESLSALPVDTWWEDWMRQADRLLDDPELVDIVYRAMLQRRPQSRTRGRLSTPAEVVLRALDPGAHEINFSVRLSQVGGPPFDPSIHRIDLTLAPPWHLADVHWHWSRDSLPADVDFTLAFGDGVLEPGATLSGNIDLTVTAR